MMEDTETDVEDNEESTKIPVDGKVDKKLAMLEGIYVSYITLGTLR